jgi:hypothetical protein
MRQSVRRSSMRLENNNDARSHNSQVRRPSSCIYDNNYDNIKNVVLLPTAGPAITTLHHTDRT